jgi:hypothetical protein
MENQAARKTQFLIFGIVVFIVLLCLVVPGFGSAIVTVFECSFAPYTCVKVLP